MIDVKDRIPAEGMANRKKLTYADGTVDYAVVEPADNALRAGTPINRALFNELQGFCNQTTVFHADGSITETDPLTGVVKTTVFDGDTITETRTAGDSILTKTTVFAADGSIIETVGV